ncbi:MAG: HEPN domain-containing protein [Nitrospirae bacterium]|nr:HEPN domain-containing protein [Nitrospirota bacterium]
MKNPERAKEWLKRAKSNLARARGGRIIEDILYEDLCFDAQQAVEKALKALCIIHGIRFSKVHDISYLMELLEKTKLKIPKRLQKAKALTDYAVETRYPGEYVPVDKDMYEEALKIAEKVVIWAEKMLA